MAETAEELPASVVGIVVKNTVSDPTTYQVSSPVFAFCAIARSPLNPAALAFVPFGIVLVRVRVRVDDIDDIRAHPAHN